MKIVDKSEIENINVIKNITKKTLLDTKFLKEDLEKYYVDEGKTLIEISKIYGCCLSTVKSKLTKYGIPIRPHGAFLVDDDGKSLHSKYIKGEISKVCYENGLSKEKNFENYAEYYDSNARKRGFKDDNDRKKQQGYIKGDHLPMSENKESPSYLGVHICENKEFLSKIINIVENMPENNPGYDVVCVRGKKVDVKCACLSCDNTWTFATKKNKITDYFLMISFDNREKLNIQRMWLVKGDSVIEKTIYNSKKFIVNEKGTITIGKGNRALKRWKKHEITDIYKLEEAQKLCDIFKNNSGDLNE